MSWLFSFTFMQATSFRGGFPFAKQHREKTFRVSPNLMLSQGISVADKQKYAKPTGSAAYKCCVLETRVSGRVMGVIYFNPVRKYFSIFRAAPITKAGVTYTFALSIISSSYCME
ncbi:MAG: hypothetical protein LBU26_05640 [Synergistaceae bacterium]|jgi:hypothetical protein|nr:hypothetical protein [Synergistaceae bacterium]